MSADEQVREAVFVTFDGKPGHVVRMYDEPVRFDSAGVHHGECREEVPVEIEFPPRRQAETMYTLQRLPDYLMHAALDLLAYGVSLSLVPEELCDD